MTPEEIADLGALGVTTAAALLPSQEEEVPPAPDEQDERKVDVEGFERAGEFLISLKGGYGAGTRPKIMIVHPDGLMEAVLIWLEREHGGLAGEDVLELLTAMGLPFDHAHWFGKQRDDMRSRTATALEHPAMQRLIASEEEHVRIKDSFSKAFVERQKREKK